MDQIKRGLCLFLVLILSVIPITSLAHAVSSDECIELGPESLLSDYKAVTEEAVIIGDSIATVNKTYLLSYAEKTFSLKNSTGSLLMGSNASNKILLLDGTSWKCVIAINAEKDATYITETMPCTADMTVVREKYGSIFDLDEGATAYYYVYFEKTGVGTSTATPQYAILIEISPNGTPFAAPVVVDRSALEKEVSRVIGSSAGNYYQINDRFNGKPIDTISDINSGFWNELIIANGPLQCAQAVLVDTQATQDDVNDACEILKSAIAKLIPIEQLNATFLYETIQTENRRNLKVSDYTALSWKAYSDAKADAEAYLASLFTTDEQGNVVATDENKAENQAKADSKANALTAAYDGLYSQSLYEQTQSELPVLKSEAAILLQKINMDGLQESNYDPDSWKTFADAYDKAIANYDKQFTNTGASSERNDLLDYRQVFSELCKAWLLLEQEGDIQITLTVNDLFGIEFEDCLLTDPETATFCGSKTLAAGHHSIKDLFDALNWDGNTTHTVRYSGSDQDVSAAYLIYINGVLVREPFMGQLPSPTSPYVYYEDVLGLPQPAHDTIQLHNNDEVVILRIAQPTESYADTHLMPVTDISQVVPYFKLLRFTTDASKLSPKEGESFTLNLMEQKAYWSTYDGRLKAAAGKEIFAYGPMKEDGTYPAEPIRTGFVTDAEGNASVSLELAGTYILTAMDLSGMDFDNHKYPGLAGGAYITITVLPLPADELAEKKTEFMDALDALLEESNESDYEAEAWTRLGTIIADGKSAIENADKMESVQKAYDQAVSDFLAVPTIDHESILDRFVHYLKYLPSVDQISAGYFSQADIERMDWITVLYNAMSDYQKEMLSPAQQAQYDALVSAYGTDGSSLPEFKQFTATVSVDENDLIYSEESSQLWAVYYDSTGVMNQLTGGVGFNNNNLKNGMIPKVTAGSDSRHKTDAFWLVVNISKEHYDLFDGIEIDEAEVDCFEVEELQFFYRYTYYILTPYNDFTIHIKAVQGDLRKAKNEALTALETALSGYNKSDYTAENWTVLTDAYSTGVADINAATGTDEVTAAKKKALDGMAAVKKKTETGVLGSVKVIVENTTFDKVDLKDTIIETTVELTQQSTMMKCVLAALAEKGYSWTGTGGKGYDITYLSSIYIDANGNGKPDEAEKSLAEFDGGTQSGWMGTLNDWFVNEGFNMFTVANGKLKDGDVIRVQYTVSGYGTDLGATWANNDTSLLVLSVSGGSLAPDFAGNTTGYVLTPSGSSVSLKATAANKNFQVRIFLNQQNKNANADYYRSDEPIPVKSGDVIWIGVGEKAWASMNDGSITGTWYKLNVVGGSDTHVVEKLISAIGSVTYENYKDKQAAVDLAKGAYDALSAADQAKVSNAEMLEAAVKAIAGFEAVKTLKAKIAALPAESSSDYRDKVTAAKKDYEALTAAQQNLLTVAETNKLLKAVNTLDLLDAMDKVSETKDFQSAEANTQSAVEAALLALDSASISKVTLTAFAAAVDGTAANLNGTPGGYSATLTFTKGTGSQMASAEKTVSGEITPKVYVKSSDAGVKSIVVSGVTAAPSGTAYTAVLPYGSDTAKATFDITPADKATASKPTTADGGANWTFTVTAEDGTTKSYTITLTISKVEAVALDSWVYAVGGDVKPVTVTNLVQAVSLDGLDLPEGTKKVSLWLELKEIAANTYDLAVLYAYSPKGAEAQAVPAAALTGRIGLTLPTAGSAYSRVLYNGDYLETEGNADGVTFTVTAAGVYTLIPDSRVASVTYHLNGGTASGLKDGETVAYLLENKGDTLPVPEKSGYAFKGWHGDSSVSSTAYTTVSNALPADLYALWQSRNTGAAVSVGGASAARSGSVFTVTMPYGSEYPKAAEITITPEDGTAVASKPLTGDDGMSWSFTVTAEDGSKQEYTLQVVIAEQTAEDILAAAKQALAGQNWDTDQRTANDAASLKTFVEGKLKGLDLSGAAYAVTIDSVTPAKAGDKQNTQGTAGSYRFTVTLSSGGKSESVNGFGSISAAAYVAPAQLADYEKALQAVEAYLKANVTNPDVGSTEGEWVVFALNRGGVAEDAWNDVYLENLKTYLDETDGILAEKNYTEYSRVILALTSMGVDATGITTEKGTYELVAHLLDKQSNGDYWAEWQGNNGTAFALLAMDSHDYLNTAAGKAARAALIASLKANQQESGAWAIEGKGTPDLDVTAAAVYALAPYYLDSSKLTALGGSVSAAEVKAMVDNALTYLSGRQHADGGFGSVEADVWAIIALSSLGRDADTDPAFVKNGNSLLADMLTYRNESTGAFRHLASGSDNQMGTEQAAYGLVAYDRFKKNQNTLYDMSDVEFATAEEKADQAAAEAVEERIDAIGEVTLESKAKIDAARAAYNALTDDQKALVGNLAVLEAAEKKYKELTESAGKEEVDRAAAKGVDDLIDAIGAVSLSSERDIQAARAAYDALTDEQKALVTKTDALKAAEAKLASLKADKAAAKAVDDLIGAIGEVTKESEAAIKAARAAYDFLTETQKQQVTKLPELIEAEWKWELLYGDSQKDDDGKLHVTMRLIGAELASKDVDLGKEAYLPNYVTWIPTTQYAVEEGTTVYDLWALATWQYGIKSVGAEKNYVATVYSPSGYALSEFTNGRRSGWMYTINGRHPGFGLKEQPLHDGDMIVWHYVSDYAYEVADWVSEGAWKALGDGTYYNRWLLAPDYFGGWGGGINAGTDSDPGSGSESGSGVNPNQVSNVVTLKAEMEATGAYAILDEATTWNWLQNTTDQSVMPIRVDSGIADRIVIQLEAIPVIGLAMRDTEVRLDTPKGTVILDPQTMDTLAENGNDVRVIIEANRNGTTTIRVNSGSRPADVDVKIELQAPYDGQVLVMVNQDGTEEVIKKSYVENGKVYAVIPAGATVKVADNGKTFGDVKARDWYADAVEFVSSHELFQGVGENKFDPQASMTRAMLVTVLYRLENEPESSGKVKFADVAEDTWYADAVAWAAETKLVNGTDKGFEPNADITREQIATILYRYAQSLGMDTKARGIVSRFGDSAEISGWAADAMAWAVEVGLFRGDENENLNPQGNATRAEVATLLERLVKLIVK